MLSGWAQRNHQTPRERAAGTAKVTKVRQDGRRRTAGFAEGGAACRGVRAAPRAGRGRGRIPPRASGRDAVVFTWHGVSELQNCKIITLCFF